MCASYYLAKKRKKERKKASKGNTEGMSWVTTGK